MKAGERAREETDSERRRPGALHRRFAVKDKVISTSALWGFQRTLLSAPLSDGARLPVSNNQSTGAGSSSTTQTNRMKCLKLSISPELGADAMGTPRGSVSRVQTQDIVSHRTSPKSASAAQGLRGLKLLFGHCTTLDVRHPSEQWMMPALLYLWLASFGFCREMRDESLIPVGRKPRGATDSATLTGNGFFSLPPSLALSLALYLAPLPISGMES